MCAIRAAGRAGYIRSRIASIVPTRPPQQRLGRPDAFRSPANCDSPFGRPPPVTRPTGGHLIKRSMTQSRPNRGRRDRACRRTTAFLAIAPASWRLVWPPCLRLGLAEPGHESTIASMSGSHRADGGSGDQQAPGAPALSGLLSEDESGHGVGLVAWSVLSGSGSPLWRFCPRRSGCVASLTMPTSTVWRLRIRRARSQQCGLEGTVRPGRCGPLDAGRALLEGERTRSIGGIARADDPLGGPGAILAAIGPVHRLREVARLDRSRLAVVAAVPGAIGYAVPLVVGLATGEVADGVAASAGALIVGFANLGGRYRVRSATLLAATVAAGVAALSGGLAGPSVVATVVLMVVWGFASGLLVSLGLRAAFVAMLSTWALLLAGDLNLHGDAVLHEAWLITAGGLGQTAVAIAAWPLRPFAAERRALADAYRALAAYARAGHRGASDATDSMMR